MNIAVYLGANPGNDPALSAAVRELGAWIARSGHTLVYGGSKAGLMGELAGAALSAGGAVIGVETQYFLERNAEYPGLTQLIVALDIPERRKIMIDLSQAFIAFPGGTGTLEEISEVISRVSMGQLHAPCILYNLNGYYESLRALFDKMLDTGLCTKERLSGVSFADNLEEIKNLLKGR